MLAEKVINILPIKSDFLKLLIKIGSAIPSAFAAIGAATFAARFKKRLVLVNQAAS